MSSVNYVFNGHNFDVLDGTKEAIRERVEKLDNIKHITSARFFFERTPDKKYKVEAVLHIKNKDLVATSISGTVKSSINSVLRKIKKQLEKEHRTLHSYHGK